MNTTQKGLPTLAVAERCDRCGAEAMFQMTNPAGLVLQFCSHHGREQVANGGMAKMLAAGFVPTAGNHVAYSHFPGALYDCLACEAVCWCSDDEVEGVTECVFHAEDNLFGGAR